MGAKILVVDDSTTIQTAVQLTLGREDVELIPARSGEEAIRKAREVVPDLMLIDAVMPDASGYDVCRALKADPATRDIPVIMLTGPSDAAGRPEGQAIDASDVISKPFESQVLISKVRQLLASRPPYLSPPVDIEVEMAPMEFASYAPPLEEIEPLWVEEAPAFGGSLTPPAIPPPPAEEESPAPLTLEPPTTPVSQPVPVSVEVPQPLLERAVAEAAEKAVTEAARGVTEKFAERIEQIVREIVPALAESLIVKEIERIKASIEGKTAE